MKHYYWVAACLVSSLILFSSITLAQPLPIEGQWQTNWGTADVHHTQNGIEGNYLEDNGRFILRPSGQIWEGYWAEDAAARECDFIFMGSRHWGRLRITPPSDFERFDIEWSYCEDTDFPWEWSFIQRLSGGTATAPSPTVKDLIARLDEERRRAMAPAAGEQPFEISKEELVKLRDMLNSAQISDEDWSKLIESHFGQGENFDPEKWSDFAEFADQAHISPFERAKAERFAQQTKDLLSIPDAAMNYLRERFYSSETLADTSVSSLYGNDFANYLTAMLSGNDPEFNRLLDDKSREAIKLATEGVEPFEPVLLPDPGVDPDVLDPEYACTFSHVLARMRRADPIFDRKWRVYVLQIVPQGLGEGSSIIRGRLVAGVRQGVIECERRASR